MNKLKHYKKCLTKTLECADFSKGKLPKVIMDALKAEILLTSDFFDFDPAWRYTDSTMSLSNTIFPITEKQFRELFTFYIKNRIEKNLKGRGNHAYTVEEIFDTAAGLLKLNSGELITEDNILFVLSIWKDLYYKYDMEKYFYDYPCAIEHNTEFRYGVYFQSILDPDYLFPGKVDQNFYSGKIMDFIKENLDIFTLDFHTSSAKYKFLAPEIQRFIPFDSDFLSEQYELFLAPVVAQNPVMKSITNQNILFGKMTEEFLSIVYNECAPSLNKLFSMDTEDILACIFRSV